MYAYQENQIISDPTSAALQVDHEVETGDIYCRSTNYPRLLFNDIVSHAATLRPFLQRGGTSISFLHLGFDYYFDI